MTGSKATALEAYARERGHAFVRFDYQGHGASSGDFRDGTIGTWAEDAVAVLDQVTEGPQILVGSSMGGWIMLLAALARPDRVRALVGIAPAPDFTERLMWARMDAKARATLERDGEWRQPSLYDDAGYPITRALIEDGRRHLLLNQPLALPSVPVRLVHGQRDPDVPWQTSLDLAAAINHDDVRVTLVKDGDHRLSRPQDLDLITRQVGELLPC
ncbi:alpha/beta hydrolase [Nitrospirillum amazonense]|uniref:alpha/beta hydrolase n=1 Tax=Nitrospirillum amazonense TaxID=28077 RepID=UPI002DD43345|nr:alpha/beta hydrolase [Nitrospirillum amazonense]MEC4592734.1 alpha/beta hydrolase [Nitrospirillum amazonense]